MLSFWILVLAPKIDGVLLGRKSVYLRIRLICGSSILKYFRVEFEEAVPRTSIAQLQSLDLYKIPTECSSYSRNYSALFSLGISQPVSCGGFELHFPSVILFLWKVILALSKRLTGTLM